MIKKVKGLQVSERDDGGTINSLKNRQNGNKEKNRLQRIITGPI